MMRRHRIVALGGALVAVAVAACTNASTSEGCGADGDCKGDRICRDGSCSDGAHDRESAQGPSPASSDAAAAAPCEDHDGLSLPNGGCLKRCEWAGDVDGTDLYGDCAPLRMRCNRDDFCEKVGACTSDAECGPDFACTFIEYAGTSCRPLCDAITCPTGTTCRLSDAAPSSSTVGQRRVCTTS